VKVLKFGGSSFVDLSDYTTVAAYLTGLLTSTDTRIAVVVSGMSGSTGRLLEAALSIDPGLHPQIQDQILATAEMVSASFLRAALSAAGCPATDLWAPQAGIRSDNAATQARIVSIDPRPLLDAFAEHRVVVVAGGQAMDDGNRITMLGRNSSDLTGVALAASLSAGRCDIYGDTPGVFTADPHVVPSARLMPRLTYEQCCQMSESGAKVLHWGAVRYAQEHGVVIRCLRTAAALAGEAAPGTSVGAGPGETAVVGDARIGLYRLPSGSDVSAAVRALRDVNLVAQAVEHHGTVLLAFPAGQRPGRPLADLGLEAEPVEGFGMVSVVTPDGTATRRLVARDDVDDTVRSVHEDLYGADSPGDGLRTLSKTRSRHSGLLLGAADAGAFTATTRE
jgi:aspartate kinase